MCNFFSLISNGNGEVKYFNWEQRKRILAKDSEFNKVESPDSHSSISSYYGYTGEKADLVNKYEYNPLTKLFIKDQINVTDDSCLVEKFCKELNFKTIVEPLNIKPIIHPFKDVKTRKVTKTQLKLLLEWDSVRNSVRVSFRDSVGSSVWISVRDSVGDSVWDSVVDAFGDSVGVSVGDSVLGYISSFFNIRFKFDFSSNTKLWEQGFVPSFDGTKWRLHSGKYVKIVWEGTLKELQHTCK